MIKLILFIIYVLLVLTVIFLERKNPTEACLWVVVMICVPYLGTLLYIIFGNTIMIKLIAFVRGKRLREHFVHESVHSVSIDESVISEEDRQVMRFNENYNASAVTCCDKSEFFITGEAHYKRLFEDIEGAKECIFVEFYTIHNDEVGRGLANALAKKAAQGVKVLVLCDFIANISTPDKIFKPLKAAGGKVIRLKPYLTHYRSHRKIVAIDHKISYIGGMNIGKQYANKGKKKNPWRDTQVRMEGACTSVLDEYFLTDWLCAVKRRDWKEAVRYIKSIKMPKYSTTGSPCQFIIGGVDNSREAVKMCYMSMIRSAKKRIRIQTPYFIPDASILDALKAAAAAGVEVELMIPGIKASFFLDPVTNYYCGQLLRWGIKVHKYNGYVHAKTMIVDDEMCCIGSVNMDMRSFLVDDEVCGVFYANETVEEYNEIFARDINSCTSYTWNDFNNRSQKERIMESVFLLFAPLM